MELSFHISGNPRLKIQHASTKTPTTHTRARDGLRIYVHDESTDLDTISLSHVPTSGAPSSYRQM